MVVPPKPTRHDRFYFSAVSDDPTPELVTFQVHNKLYRVYRKPLENNSAVFASMFAVPQGPDVEGMSDENPIILEAIPVEEFEALLFVLYPVDLTQYIDVSPRIWLSSVAAAVRWEVPTLKALAMSHIEKGGPVPRLIAARRCGEDRWLRPSIEELCRRTECLTAAEVGLLDPKDAAYIASIREGIYARRLGPIVNVIAYLDYVVGENPLPT